MKSPLIYCGLIILSLMSPSEGTAMEAECAAAIMENSLPPAIRALRRSNNRLIDADLPPETLVEEKLWVPHQEPVFNIKKGAPNLNDRVPFQRVELSKAKTSMFVPDDLNLLTGEGIDKYDGLIILIPGIGTNLSNATTLFNLGMTFKSGKNRALSQGEGKKKLRLAPILLDATLSGTGSRSDIELGSSRGTTEVVHHAKLLLKEVFPEAKVFVGGRSQGGLIAMEYAERFGGIEGVIAANPSPSNTKMHKRALRLSVANMNELMGADSPVHLNRSFESYVRHTPGYWSFSVSPRDRLMRFLVREFSESTRDPVPVLLLVGQNDMSYEQPHYTNHCLQYAQIGYHREVELFDFEPHLSHDLFSRSNKRNYEKVVKRMAQFIGTQLESSDTQ